MYPQEGDGACPVPDTSTSAEEENEMSIREIRELLIAAGERRQRLGQLARDRQLEGQSSRLDVSQALDEEPKALEES
jgi:hypothetical protein